MSRMRQLTTNSDLKGGGKLAFLIACGLSLRWIYGQFVNVKDGGRHSSSFYIIGLATSCLVALATSVYFIIWVPRREPNPDLLNKAKSSLTGTQRQGSTVFTDLPASASNSEDDEFTDQRSRSTTGISVPIRNIVAVGDLSDNETSDGEIESATQPTLEAVLGTPDLMVKIIKYSGVREACRLSCASILSRECCYQAHEGWSFFYKQHFASLMSKADFQQMKQMSYRRSDYKAARGALRGRAALPGLLRSPRGRARALRAWEAAGGGGALARLAGRCEAPGCPRPGDVLCARAGCRRAVCRPCARSARRTRRGPPEAAAFARCGGCGAAACAEHAGALAGGGEEGAGGTAAAASTAAAGPPQPPIRVVRAPRPAGSGTVDLATKHAVISVGLKMTLISISLTRATRAFDATGVPIHFARAVPFLMKSWEGMPIYAQIVRSGTWPPRPARKSSGCATKSWTTLSAAELSWGAPAGPRGWPRSLGTGAWANTRRRPHGSLDLPSRYFLTRLYIQWKERGVRQQKKKPMAQACSRMNLLKKERPHQEALFNGGFWWLAGQVIFTAAALAEIVKVPVKKLTPPT